MKLLVDGKEVREASAGRLASAYREVVGGLLDSGRIIVSVALAGRVLDRDEQTRVLDGEPPLRTSGTTT